MAKYMSMEHLRYVLFDVMEGEQLFKFERFQDHDKDSMNIFFDSIKDFSDQELYPCFREMDEQPAHYDNGKIVVHPALEKILPQTGELGLVAAPFDYEDGGLQMPLTFHTAAMFIAEAANNNVPGYPGLTGGAANLIATFGSKVLKEQYVPNMLTQEWGGTMCLTEPQAGSSLSDITTTATPSENGSYKIKGQKIFISGGDHEYSSNIIHLVLARIDGAPAGTKGISLFVVPKKRINGDTLENNDVLTAGDFQKMGQRGYCTTHLVFGENDDCQGWLLGEANFGLKYMFQMMNGARIAVGRSGVAISTAAYYASLQYANERPQGRRLTNTGQKDLSQGQTLIINHPDVRRMLFLQKAVAEGSLALMLQTALYHDLHMVSEGAEKEKYYFLEELLTPILKTYPAEMGQTSVSNGLQILGGYGFCSEFVLQQYHRDIRIMSLYEGTTGIQSLDLLGRKVTMKGGKAMMLIGQEMGATINEANTYDELKPYAKKLSEQMHLTTKVVGFLTGFAQKGEFERFLSDATLFMDFFGTIVLGWQWLKLATAAKKALVTGDKTQTEEFFESQIHTMKFFFKYEIPKTAGLAQSMMDTEVLTLKEEKELIL
ncbi:MAG: acyl-CoA dehydrogenase [Bacteroidetes bacterium]|nr:acyl-CoA dehydrogenase [Bacteroidota bacterium]MDF1864892.1 acyl-CoA dehydrogenase [Saprospiraceae bacterium]